MNDSEAKLIKDMRNAAASHRRTGEPRTAALLEKGAQKIERLLGGGRPPLEHEFDETGKCIWCPAEQTPSL